MHTLSSALLIFYLILAQSTIIFADDADDDDDNAATSSITRLEAQALLAFKHAITDDPSSCLSSHSVHIIPGPLHNSTSSLNGRINNVNHCSWCGVLCDSHFRVISLDLSNRGLSGSISSSLGLLSSLSDLDLSYNNLSGVLSPSIFPYPNSSLTYLDLSYNPDLSGEIPESLPLHSAKLQFLDLSYTFLTGAIPPALWTHLPVLQTLAIGSTYVTYPLLSMALGSFLPNGSRFSFCDTIEVFILLQINVSGASFPSSLGNCTRLKTLELFASGLHGSMPSSIWQLPHLRDLVIVDLDQFRGNLTDFDHDVVTYKLSWAMPSTFGFCSPPASNITAITVDGIGLTGNIPASVDACAASLQFLAIAETSLEGPLPSTLGNLTQLSHIFFLSNKLLTGGIPDGLEALQKLEYLVLSGNSLTGGIPASLGALTNLWHLDLSQNNLTGILPVDILHNLTQLLTLTISRNHLSGKIESLDLSKLPNLEIFDAYGNIFEGGLPAGLTEHQTLRFINLQENKLLTGSLGNTTTANITGLSKLRVLSVSYNQHNGCIPAWLWHLPSLQVLDLSNNRFTGHIPASLTHLSYFRMTNQTNDIDLSQNLPITIKNEPFILSYVQSTRILFDVSMNMLGGEIPKSFGELQGLRGINLSHNQFNGTIPEGSFGRLKNLDVLDLSYNQLTGEIPQDLANFDISTLNLSSNQLQGQIPTQNSFNTRNSFNTPMRRPSSNSLQYRQYHSW